MFAGCARLLQRPNDVILCDKDEQCPAEQFCFGGICKDGPRQDGGALPDGGSEDGGYTDGGSEDGGYTDGGSEDGGSDGGGDTDGGLDGGRLARIGELCLTNEECESLLCIPTTLGGFNKVCTYVCGGRDCPDDWSCGPYQTSGGLIPICRPDVDIFCAQCPGGDDNKCGEAKDKCVDVDDGLYCLMNCDGRSCPMDFTCRETVDRSGSPTKLCFPDRGFCTTCVPRNCTQLNYKCGDAEDGCGTPIDCGPCPSYPNYECRSNICYCDPDTCTGIQKDCGSWPDGCGETLNCPNCPADRACNANGKCCHTCTKLGRECGTVSDGCGGTLNCSTCPVDKECSAQGKCCYTCTSLDKRCGNWDDGCGNNIYCGPCEQNYQCTSNGRCKKMLGISCAAGEECESGLCVDEVCCNTACSAICYNCATGVCTKITNSDDPPQCTDYNTCDIYGNCRKKNGRSCNTGSECASGNCQDSRCCNTACNQPCQDCTTGTCTPIQNQDDVPNCQGTYTCSATGLCLKRNGLGCFQSTECASGFCKDNKCCPTACTEPCYNCATGVCAPVRDQPDDPECAITKTCSSAGICQSKLGQPCNEGTQCISGFCKDGRCCQTACTDPCYSCNNGDGTCTLIKNAEDSPECSGDQICNGSGLCKKKNGKDCIYDNECATNQCTDGKCCDTACSTACFSCLTGTCLPVFNGDDISECMGTRTCDSNGLCKTKIGQDCLSPSECSSGFCKDGRCCDSACLTPCHSCSTGICTLLKEQEDYPECSITSICNGSGQCKIKGGNPCDLGGECLSGFCEDSYCCDKTCSGTCRACNISGLAGLCEVVTHAADSDTCDSNGTKLCSGDGGCLNNNGQSCLGGCASGYCKDGKCCNTACDMPCQSCNPDGGIPGTCVAVKEVEDDPECTSTKSCSINGECKKKNGQSCGQDGDCLSNNCEGNQMPYYCCPTTCESGTCKIAGVCQLSPASKVAGGFSHSCAILEFKTVECWGRNNMGQLGDGTRNSIDIANTVEGITTAIDVGAGDYHSCAILEGGQVKCWGWNEMGQLGAGLTDDYKTLPVTVDTIGSTSDKQAVALSLGGEHGCAMVQSGKVMCWGRNSSGQLGTGSNSGPELCGGVACSTTPVEVGTIGGSPGTKVTAISMGGEHGCALLVDGTVWCWGKNNDGQLGNGTNTAFIASPVQVWAGATTQLTGVSGLALGQRHSCAFKQDGTVWCWGSNLEGQLGLSESGIKKYATLVTQLYSSASGLSGGQTSTCAVVSGDSIYCWGAGNATPAAVPNIFTAKAVGLGGFHACAVMQGKTVQCWWNNTYGQLGDGTKLSTDNPVTVLGN